MKLNTGEAGGQAVCTRVMWNDNGHGVIVGRNMDWLEDMGTNLWVLPRSAKRAGMDRDPNPLRWTARYGSVIASVHDYASADGINERGLAAQTLWLAESDYGPRDTSLPGLSLTLWTQFFLDQFSTVADCMAYMAGHPFQVRPQQETHSGRAAAVHLALDDATGDSAIIEYIDGAPRVHHGRGYAVMTNSPPFDEQLAHVGRYRGFGGNEPLPGTTEADDRFVRASYYLRHLPKPDSSRNAYAALLSVMRNAAQPFGVADPARPNISATIWRTLADLTNGIYAFESSYSPDIVWVHLNRVHFDRCQRLDLSADDLAGDVTDALVPATPFAFASAP
jgi:penicillin V acylase-like amidase (Ntn superfamily)